MLDIPSTPIGDLKTHSVGIVSQTVRSGNGSYIKMSHARLGPPRSFLHRTFGALLSAKHTKSAQF